MTKVDRAKQIIERAEADLGPLSFGQCSDLLLDNMPDVKGCDEAHTIVKALGRSKTPLERAKETVERAEVDVASLGVLLKDIADEQEAKAKLVGYAIRYLEHPDIAAIGAGFSLPSTALVKRLREAFKIPEPKRAECETCGSDDEADLDEVGGDLFDEVRASAQDSRSVRGAA